MKLGTQVGLGPGHIVLDGDPAPPPPKGHSPPIFGPYLLRPNGCMDQHVTWYGARPRPRRLCVRWGPSSPPPKGGGAPLPNFRPISIVTKRLDQDANWYGGRSQPRELCVRCLPSPLNFRPMLIIVIVISLYVCSSSSSGTLCILFLEKKFNRTHSVPRPINTEANGS